MSHLTHNSSSTVQADVVHSDPAPPLLILLFASARYTCTLNPVKVFFVTIMVGTTIIQHQLKVMSLI